VCEVSTGLSVVLLNYYLLTYFLTYLLTYIKYHSWETYKEITSRTVYATVVRVEPHASALLSGK